ncbi:MAG: alpha/beta fold hydrolase [Gordonia sp. (in: high G+C Gram-positive bacteria)]|uniref:esterase/lipase family protein n=1 Tax=Gordonia sp. (in: high G+C Gram-positive bacteria) TaxID=84139 RepID=UPI0039E48D29
MHANIAPQGANDFHCKPKAGQNPVVLVHGTYENAYNSWANFAPALKKAGYCVFTPDYGKATVLNQGGVMTVLPAIEGVAPIRESGKQIAGYIDRVRKATGSAKVDVISHSQGGLVMREFLKYFGGANLKDPSKNKVQRLIMISTPNHGTTLDGIASMNRAVADAGLDATPMFAWTLGAGPMDQAVGSPAIKALNKGRVTYPGIEYTAVSTKYDEVVTPHETAYLHARGVNNLLLQQGCEQDTSDHLTITYSARMLSIAERALDSGKPAAQRTKVLCRSNPWLFVW